MGSIENVRRCGTFDGPSGKDYVLQIKIKNGPLLRAMRAAGFISAKALAATAGMAYGALCEMLALKIAPQRMDGEWRPSVLRLAKTLRTLPEDLFPSRHLREGLSRSSAEIDMSVSDVAAIVDWGNRDTPEDNLIADEQQRTLADCLTQLPPREHRVLALRYGLDGKGERTLEEIGVSLSLSRERISQIERSALRRLRRPSVASRLIATGLGRATKDFKRLGTKSLRAGGEPGPRTFRGTQGRLEKETREGSVIPAPQVIQAVRRFNFPDTPMGRDCREYEAQSPYLWSRK